MSAAILMPRRIHVDAGAIGVYIDPSRNPPGGRNTHWNVAARGGGKILAGETCASAGSNQGLLRPTPIAAC